MSGFLLYGWPPGLRRPAAGARAHRPQWACAGSDRRNPGAPTRTRPYYRRVTADTRPGRLTGQDAPPPEVTAELFATWRAARRGTADPERLTNPVWAWLARRSELSAWSAAHHFGAGSSFGRAPGWCNNRFGQSMTTLPDGRVVAVAGEHEDYYDPDFFIYNDVIVTAPDDGVEIFGYPPEVFPPTDFHSATLVGGHTYLVGNLGYVKARRNRTQVLRLDVGSMAVEVLGAGGECPGWLSEHSAVLDGDGRSLRVSGGQVDVEVAGRRLLRAAGDDYTLDLDRLVWTRITDRRWRQYRVARVEGRGRLFDIGLLADLSEDDSDWKREQAARYRGELGDDVDVAAWHDRYRPPVPHETVTREATDDAWRTHRIRVDGVTVRYVESDDVHVIVEGPLPEATEAAILADLRAKLTRADAAAYAVSGLDG